MVIIPKRYDSLEFVRDISWPEIFAVWKEGEASQESWKKHWESRGFSSWDEWREAYSAPLRPENLEWRLFRISKPLEDVPFFYGVPSEAWIEKAYQGKSTRQLKGLVGLPIISENPKITDLKKTFPKKTMLTGIIFEEKIVLYEGMHRAGAIASWDPDDRFGSEVTIALSRWTGKNLPLVGGNFKK